MLRLSPALAEAGPPPARAEMRDGAAASISVRPPQDLRDSRRHGRGSPRATFDVKDGEFVRWSGRAAAASRPSSRSAPGLVVAHAAAGRGRRRSSAKPGRRDVGIMFQAPVLLPWRTVLDNVLLPTEIFRIDKGNGGRRGRWSCSTWSGSRASRTSTRGSCQAGCSSAPASRACSSLIPTSCLWTSRSPRSTSSPASG